MKLITTLVIALLFSLSAFAQHEMQHGFIISNNEEYFSHLVATGHHSHQLSFVGKLSIPSASELKTYLERKRQNSPRKSYFLFQAQHLNLPATTNGQILKGHIIESGLGDYTPGNVIVKEAEIMVERITINVPNPFFTE